MTGLTRRRCRLDLGPALRAVWRDGAAARGPGCMHADPSDQPVPAAIKISQRLIVRPVSLL
jgi:hypothetical protein